MAAITQDQILDAIANMTVLEASELVKAMEEKYNDINEKLMESPMMPHEETISIMKQMDDLRKEWGVRYPYDESYS
mgnify:CR=1 FL=1